MASIIYVMSVICNYQLIFKTHTQTPSTSVSLRGTQISIELWIVRSVIMCYEVFHNICPIQLIFIL